MASSPPLRLLRRDGSTAHIVRVGLRRGYLSDLYHFLLTTRWPVLLAVFVGTYLAGNLLFALLYLAGGDTIENARPGSFEDAYFFSVQTMATIGYGKMAPQTVYGHVLVTIEALFGLILLALATGLVFAKFSRPTARVLFSQVAVVAPRDGVPTLMFRMANERGNQIVEAHVRVSLLRSERTLEGEAMRRFHPCELSRSENPTFALTWTVMHPIDAKSPLHGMTREALQAVSGELIVSLMGTDEATSQTVHARFSYVPDEIRFGERFADIISVRPDGRRQIDYGLFHQTEPLPAERQVKLA